MTTMIRGRKAGARAGKSAAGIPITPQEKFVTGVYASLDAAIARELDRLCREEEIIPSCTSGCPHCCRYHIMTNSAEAHTLARYIKREMSQARIRELRMRTRQWHEWDNSRPGRYPPAKAETRTDIPSHDYRCPLLAHGSCIAYPVRPVVCRTHFVRSHPRSCRAAHDPESADPAPVVIRSVVASAGRFTEAIKGRIEKTGVDYSRSILLLPHWLAIEMGWDFSLSG
jgi:Fe-S-cluster containining protein